ncbi:hypothetical protein SJ05684_b49840 (plasmid) [Sinorhizobium sojae CCBAU 05684]|uniref:Uncharacterized protein n=1 Tax=Sinorhizobium sojae CCBAU 05684 TaxID=716928 RepID=A0A249PJJ0_9HYPH|nr:hypothetical protein [Sinorhizobium sojae]ASY65966.1 hypothetical protein SJ05684_b49840 [Sinorhizobium sojae CCBAU 05684]
MPIGFRHSPTAIPDLGLANDKSTPRASSHDGLIDRHEALATRSAAAHQRAGQFLTLAKSGLPRMQMGGTFVHTMRAVGNKSRSTVVPEGESLRYTSIVALGLSWVNEPEQRLVLKGQTAADLARSTIAQAEASDEPGAIALAAWAAAEAAESPATLLLRRLLELLETAAPIATVDCAWTLSAALAGRHLADTRALATLAARRLLECQARSGLFPHMLPGSASGRLRAHVGCFADQVYPIQALARLHAACGDFRALDAADACAERICALQGPHGQWWWHYDVRDGSVVEEYPVYSVHQHAMAPMALLDLREAGGRAHWQPIIKGLEWLDQHTEVAVPLVADEEYLIWRKVMRREPGKVVRAIAAATTALKPGLHPPSLNIAFPPNQVDYECRPYELGWLLYAWLSGGVVARLAGVHEHR